MSLFGRPGRQLACRRQHGRAGQGGQITTATAPGRTRRPPDGLDAQTRLAQEPRPGGQQSDNSNNGQAQPQHPQQAAVGVPAIDDLRVQVKGLVVGAVGLHDRQVIGPPGDRPAADDEDGEQGQQEHQGHDGPEQGVGLLHDPGSCPAWAARLEEKPDFIATLLVATAGTELHSVKRRRCCYSLGVSALGRLHSGRARVLRWASGRVAVAAPRRVAIQQHVLSVLHSHSFISSRRV